MWLWLFMNTQMSIWNLIFKPNVIIQWGCGKIFFVIWGYVLGRVICAWCRCAVVIHVVLYWWKMFCSSMEWAAIWCRALSSLNVKWWHTELWILCHWGQCAGCGCTVVGGAAKSKDRFSQAEIWYSHGGLHRGVGIFNLSLPLSHPLFSSASYHSKASLRVDMKWPNSTSSDMFLNCCAELLQKKAVQINSMASLRIWGLRSAIQKCNAATMEFQIEYSLANSQ